MIADWYSGAVIWKFEDGELYFLLQEVTTIDPRYLGQKTQIKGPGGKSRGTPDIDPLATLKREFFEELNLRLRDGVNPETLYSVVQGVHQKNFFLVSYHDLEGILRNYPIKDGASILGAPFWVPASFAKGVVYATHRRAFDEAFRRLSRTMLHLTE